MMNKIRKNKKRQRIGFTLIELLVVIAIISILATAVFVALNPIQRFRDARNSRRWTDINNLLTALHECIIDNDGSTGDCIPSHSADTEYEIVVNGAGTGCNSVCTDVADTGNCLDMESAADFNKYLKESPVDPGGVTEDHTEYQFVIDTNNIITITACSAESPETYGVTDTIRVSR